MEFGHSALKRLRTTRKKFRDGRVMISDLVHSACEEQGKELGFYKLKERKKKDFMVYKKGKEENVLQVYGDYGSS